MLIARLSAAEWGKRVVLALLFVLVGGLIILVFSPWRPMLDWTPDYLGRIGISAGLLAAAVLMRRRPRLEPYSHIVFGLALLAVAVSLDLIFGLYLSKVLKIYDTHPSGWAVIKLDEFLVVALTIVVGTRLWGGSMGSIFIQKGKLKQSLIIGGIAYLVAAAGSIPMAWLFKAPNLTLERILPWTPWVLIYVLSNGAMEELMFRGLFLRKLTPFFGPWISILLIGFVFTVLHLGATYSADQRIFIPITFVLALVWGFIMHRTDTLWGSALFHAGMDIPIMLGIFSNL